MADNRYHAFVPPFVDFIDKRRIFIHNALGEAVRVAEVNEQNAAMVTLPVNPAGELDSLSGVAFVEFAAMMCSVRVHDFSLIFFVVFKLWTLGHKPPIF